VTGFNLRTDRPVPRSVTAAVILIYVSLAINVATSITHGRNAIIVLILALPTASLAWQCYAGKRAARLPLTLLFGFIALQAVVFAPPWLKSASVADQVLGLVDIAIAVLYVVAAVLFWVSASNAYFDADPRWRSARRPQPDVARQAEAEVTVLSATQPPENPLWRNVTVLIAVLFGALVVLIAGLGLFSGSGSGQSPETKGYRYGTANSDPMVTDCKVESERRYGQDERALQFEIGCVRAQADAVLNATNGQPTP
jgi:hypothetical protein